MIPSKREIWRRLINQMERTMKTTLAVVIVLSISILVLPSQAAAEGIPVVDVSGQTVNSAPILGPEGIARGSDGSIYIGGHDGKIWSISPAGEMHQFADLNNLPGERKQRIGAVGLALDAEGNLYVATLDFDGGCVLKVIGPGKPDAGAVSLFRRGIGMANFILIDRETSTMYVSDSSMFSGRVFRFNMADASKIGSAADEKTELLGKFRYAIGVIGLHAIPVGSSAGQPLILVTGCIGANRSKRVKVNPVKAALDVKALFVGRIVSPAQRNRRLVNLNHNEL